MKELLTPASVEVKKDKATKPINILLVDDRPENLISLESILEQEGRNILKANSGEEALVMALEKEIAMILLDVQMPGMDGFEVARLLKENSHTKDIAIIFVTALSKDEKYSIQGYEEGAVDYLLKPLDTFVVQAKVNVFSKLYLQQRELKENNELLHRTNKQLDEFVYIVSHDLKAPLRGLSSLATFLEDEIGANPKPEVQELLNMMKSRTGRMQQLIDGILHYSRLANTKGEPENVCVKDLITNIIDLVAPPDSISFEIADNLPSLNCEKIKLHEVFQNLISNAIKYMDKPEGRIVIGFQEQEDHYEFWVKDNGMGIKQDHLEKIFGLFQTLLPKDECESTGIGLTIVKKIVESEKGRIKVSSVFKEGSTFSFTWNK
ncbi:MAG TPA: response regulator [Bacteroidia bacterium]|nr:response regulator [Bacteroidia bacterium]